jgi:hypothetical protein
MNTYDTTFEDELANSSLDVRFHYDFTPGKPAYTPRGEYAPIDPPEPPEIIVTKIEVHGEVDGKLAWKAPTEAEARLLWSWYENNSDLQLAMMEEAERWHYEGPDPDRAYDEWKDRQMEGK